ncbi:MAG: amidohydrolase family protein [Burkholderiales bacterium]|nr:amidohydrolase family protein [Anaerolineae bacterium]
MRVDTHQHFWKLSEVAYPWLVPAYGVIYDTFEPHQLEALMRAAGIDKTVVVQSANSHADTESMLVHSDYNDWIAGVVGWVNLLDPDATNSELEMYKQHPKFRGMRHLIHEEANPDWVVQDVVIESLKVLAAHGLSFDVVAVFPNHLKHVPTLAERVPDLKMVIDHLAKPPIKDKQMGAWADQMRAAAESPNVYAKVSGLNTAADWANWTADDLRPYLDFTREVFDAERMMFGSDWPVSLLAGGFEKVWAETNKALSGYSQADQDAILGGTAVEFYRL